MCVEGPDPAPIEGKQPPMRLANPRLTGMLCCLLLLGAPQASQAMDLAAHKAFYRLTLSSTENSGVTNASGAMEYEVIDGCTGWATQQRLDMTVLDREGGDTHTVSDYSTWESKDGKNFRFRITQSTNDDREVRAGWAEIPPGKPGFAVYTAPDPRRVVLPAGTVFPMAQTEAVLAAAHNGQMFLSVPVFDGTATNAVENTFAVITLAWPNGADGFCALEQAAEPFRAHGIFRYGYDADAAGYAAVHALLGQWGC